MNRKLILDFYLCLKLNICKDIKWEWIQKTQTQKTQFQKAQFQKAQFQKAQETKDPNCQNTQERKTQPFKTPKFQNTQESKNPCVKRPIVSPTAKKDPKIFFFMFHANLTLLTIIT